MNHPKSTASKATRRTTAASTPRTALARTAVVGAVALTGAALLCSPALAHVSVQPEGEAAQGGYATVSFKVPNERDDASTTKVEVSFPADHPLASVLPQPVPGWKAEVTRSKLDKPLELHGKKITEAVTKVTWTAEGKGVQPGYFQKFPLSIGQLPEDEDELVFKALQTYSNREVVRWIEVPQEGQAEPEFPAPVLELADAEEDGHHHGPEKSDEAAEADDPTATKHPDAGDDDTDTMARVLGLVGILVGVAGVAFGVLAGRRRTTL